MKLALKLAWEYRWNWIAMLMLTSASSLMLLLGLHGNAALNTVGVEVSGDSISGPSIDVMLVVVASLLIVQTIAALCLEGQARDLAIIKTCGASPRSIRRTLRAEIIGVSLIGFMLAVPIALIAIPAYSAWGAQMMYGVTGRSFGYDGGTFVWAAVLILAAVVIGAQVTIRRVSRQNVVSALQGETPLKKKKKRVLSMIILILASLGAIGVVVGVALSGRMVDMFKESMATATTPEQIADAASQLTFMQTNILTFLPMLFVLLLMIIVGALAPRLYYVILNTLIARRLPKNSPAVIEVGAKQATYNANKYYGSITPLIVFILAIVMLYNVTNGSGRVFAELAARNGFAMPEGMVNGVNSGAVVYSLGPPIFVAIVGALANIVMSSRGRIYTHKLTSIIGARRKQLFKQSLVEAMSYVFVAAFIGLIALLSSSLLVWIGANNIVGGQQKFVVDWLSYVLAVGFVAILMAIPAVISVVQSRKLPSKRVLESFGE